MAEEAPREPDDYRSKLLKYIPAEVIALYLTLFGIIGSERGVNVTLHWVIFVFCAAGAVLYLWRVQKVTKWKQIAISAVAFVIWVYAIGGAFKVSEIQNTLYGALLLPMYTFLIPIIDA